MRRRIFECLSLLAIVLVATTAAVVAQTLVSGVPPEYEQPVDTWATPDEVANSPFHRQRFADVYSGKVRAGRVADIANDMVDRFGALDWAGHASDHQKIMNQLRFFITALDSALRSPGIEGPLDTSEEQSTFLNALNAHDQGLKSLGMETVRDANGNDVPCYFKETPDQLPLYEWADDGEHVRLLLPADEVREWRLLQNALSNLVEVQTRLIGTANVQYLRDAVERWENYLDRGYSQMPWESLINGWVIAVPGFPKLGPPNHQWIIVHPTVGLELGVDPLDETRVKEAMHIEVLGHIRYHGEKLGNYWGVSAIISLREDLDPGVGALVHISRNWNLGVTWHDVDEDPFIVFSADLFQFAKREVTKYVERYNEVRADLGGE